MQLENNTLLNNGVVMPLLGLGVYDMYGQKAIEAILTAIDLGYRLIDTASMYENEREVGQAIKISGLDRSSFFITTKVNNNQQGFENTLAACDQSLDKLNCDYIDLYLIHWPIKQTRQSTWKALEKLYRDQKVRAIGVANYPIPFLEEMANFAVERPAVNQVEFSPYLFQKDLLSYCQQKGILLQAYCPLIRGLKMDDPKWSILSKKYNKSPAQIILRWNLQHGISAIPKSIHRQRLLENFSIFDFHLSDDEMEYIDSFNENFRVVDDPMTLF